jgi:hypothetical protein
MSDKFNSLVARLAKQLPPTALQEPITGYLGHHDEDDPMLTDDNKYVYFRAEDPEAPEVDKALISQRLLRVAEGYLQHNMKLEIVRTKKNKFRVKDLDINDEADNFALTPLESNVQIGSGNLTGDPITLEMGGTGNDLSDDGPGYLAQLTNGAVVTNIKCNFSATVAPDEFSDSSQGYSVGSYWYNTTADTAYTCMDASVGAAVWKQITGAAPDNAKYWVSQANSTLTDEVNLGALGDGILYNNETAGVSTPSIIKCNLSATAAPTINDDSGDDYIVGSRWLDTTNDKEYVCLDNSLGAAVWKETTVATSDVAPKNAKYWVSEANGSLSDEVNLGALGDGILYNNETGGVSTPSIATSAEIVNSITNGTFPAAKLVANSITAGEIAPNAIGSSELADNAVDTAAIQDANVTDVKIATLTGTKNRGTSGRLILLQGAGSSAVELAGTNTGDVTRWTGSTWAAARPRFGEIIGLAPLPGAGSFTSTLSGSADGAFDHLIFILQLRTDRALSTIDGITVRFNGDGNASNYVSFTSKIIHSASLTTTEYVAGTYAGGNLDSAALGASATGGYYPYVQMFIADYNGGAFKTVHFTGYHFSTSGMSPSRVIHGGFVWLSASAITTITFTPEFGPNWVAGSSYSLYGIGQR